ncbi:MAG: cysteine desulfurase [Saprospiraceae bacterium]|nr:cysteine desulfurase [Saprospiraceae bacterium]
MKRVYLDNAATTQMDPQVIEFMVAAMNQYHGNPSSIHAEGRVARAAIEQARKKVANYLGASIGEIIFTSCGTESNNMALKCSVRDLGVRRIISSPTEHHCVLHSLDSISNGEQAEVKYLSVDEKGRIDMAQLEQWLREDDTKTLVSLMHANNEIGTMIDLAEVSRLCQQYNALFHTDTVQTMAFFSINLSEIKVNFLTGSAHKFHGPKGIGFLYMNKENIVKPFIDGGAQERNMRAGTENLHGIIGLAKAMEVAVENMEQNRAHITAVRNYFKARLESEFEDIQFNGDPDNGNYKVLSVSFPASPKGDLLLFNLDINGVSVSGGSACSSGADAGSHVIAALHGNSDRKTIRFSFSHFNTMEEIDFVIDQLKKILPELVKDTASVVDI